MTTSATDAELVEAARAVRARAHARYSNYLVGAAVLDDNDRVHVGCNVENASYPEGSCAEANAIGAMVAAGGTRIRAIAVVGGPGGDGGTLLAHGVGHVTSCTPCGGCRQRIREFADADTRILLVDDAGEIRAHGIEELLPAGFAVT